MATLQSTIKCLEGIKEDAMKKINELSNVDGESADIEITRLFSCIQDIDTNIKICKLEERLDAAEENHNRIFARMERLESKSGGWD